MSSTPVPGQPRVRIGTSGWSYDHWDGVLYPPGAPAASRLGHYVAAFDTVELNASFYRWPREATFSSWRLRLPPGFAFTVEAPRWLTHARKLRPDHDHLYAGSYSDDDLRWWAERIGEWTASGLAVWGYFNNDGGGHAVRNALRLRELLGGG